MSETKFEVPALQLQSVIVITATIPLQCQRFWFNLEAANGDVLLQVHTMYDFNNGQINRDSKLNGKWTGQETDGPKFQVAKGKRIEIRLRANVENYAYSVDGMHYFNFKHRIPKERASSLVVHNLADVKVTYEMPEHFTFKIPQLDDGTVIVVTAGIPWKCERFWLNLLADNGDVLMQAHTMYDFNNGQINRDAMLNGKWTGQENDGPKFQVARGMRIEIRIRANAANYEYSVDGVHYFYFKHRAPKELVNSLVTHNLNAVVVSIEKPQQTPVELVQSTEIVETVETVSRVEIIEVL